MAVPPQAVLAALALLAPVAVATAQELPPQNREADCGNTRNDFGPGASVYDAINNNGDGRIGPRRLVVQQTGRIVSRGTRLFVQATPMDTDRLLVTLRKTDGRARTTVTICATEEGTGARQRILTRFDVPRGRARSTFTRTLNGIRDERISVRLEGRSVTDTLAYELLVERPNAGVIWRPSLVQLGRRPQPVQGFADLHTHHASRFGFGGGWYAGEMEGPFVEPPGHLDVLRVTLPGRGTFVLRPGHAGTAPVTWNSTSHQQMGFAALRAAHRGGLRLIVSHGVNSEWLCGGLAFANEKDRQLSCNDMESAKIQIRAMKRFDERHDWYRIVTNPWEARDAIARGQLAVVLGIEVSNVLPSSDGDWLRQLDDLYAMGVRQIYIAHETNNRFAGTARHHTAIFTLPNVLTAWFSPEVRYADDGTGRNPVGLTPLGVRLVREMMRRNMLIDVDHLSWAAVDRVATISASQRFYPLFAGHTRVTRLITSEHLVKIPELHTPPRVMDYIRRSGGIAGIRTGPERIRPYLLSGVPDTCGGSVTSLIQTYRAIADEGVPVAFGSDLNGFVTMTGPRFGPEACPDAPPGEREAQAAQQVAPPAEGRPERWAIYSQRGVADIGTLPSLLHDMRFLGADTTSLENSAEAFLRMWERGYRNDRTRVTTPPPAVPVPGR